MKCWHAGHRPLLLLSRVNDHPTNIVLANSPEKVIFTRTQSLVLEKNLHN